MLKYLERHKVALVYIPFIIYWIALLAATSFPVNYIPTTGVSDKFEHLFAYFGLAILLNLTLMFQSRNSLFKSKAVMFTIIFSSVYGIMDEVHQLLIPGRSCELLDLTADLIGIILGVITVSLLVKLDNYRLEEI